MRCKFIILVVFFLFPGCLKTRDLGSKHYSKNTETKVNNEEENSDSTTSDVKDIFNCKLPIEPKINWGEWEKYLQDNLALDDASLDSIPGGIYNVFIQFEIDEVGRVSNVSVLIDPGYGLGQRVANIISGYKGYWEPSQTNESPYKSYRRQPITFVVEEEGKSYIK